jgi:Cu/Ag efflux protein CusF
MVKVDYTAKSRWLLIVAVMLALSACERQPQDETERAPSGAPPAQAPAESPAEAPAATDRHRADGRIEAIHEAEATVTITHDPVDDLGWPSMTMDFRIDDPTLLTGLEEGQRVRFTFEEDPPGYVVTEIAAAE